MRYINTIIGLLAIPFFSCIGNAVYAQEIKTSSDKTVNVFVHNGAYNFNIFTLQYKAPCKEWLANNKGYSNHPDANFVTDDNPSNAIELFAKRTNDSRYFIDKDTASKFYILKANEAINYLKNGQWLAIDKRLSIQQKNIYEASHQPEPVGFDVANKISYIKTFSGPVYFNNWQLIGEKGSNQTLLAIADWSNFSAGDDGIKITDIFPGIDAEMIVDKGSIKTNFIVKQNQFKGYEQLIFTDEFKAPQPGVLSFSSEEESKGDVNFVVGKKALIQIGSANMYVESKPIATNQLINYSVSGNHLSLLIKENDLDNMLSAGTVLIDPQVSSMDSIAISDIGGSMNDGNPNSVCKYSLPITLPAKATFTYVGVQFGYSVSSLAYLGQANAFFGMKGCSFYYTYGDPPTDSNYFKTNYSLYTKGWGNVSAFISNCFPPPSCTTQDVKFLFGMYNTVANSTDSGACSNKYESAYKPFQVLLGGYTSQLNSISSPTSICHSGNTTLSATGMYGVPPYTYSWDHGGGNNSTVIVTPATTTNYTVTISDQCGDTATGSTLVTVIPQVTPAIIITTPDTSVCLGTPVTFSATATGGGNNPIYQWKLNGNSVGTNGVTYTNNTLSNNDSIYCVFTSNAACATTPTAISNTVVMSVLPILIPSVNITASANGVCGEIPITFTAIAVNAGPSPSYQWKLNGNNFGGNDSLYVSDSIADGDMVSCIISVSNTGCYTNPTATSNQLSMDIRPIPGIVLTASRLVIPKDDTTQLNAIITGGYTSFAWTPTTGLSDPLITNPIAIPLSSTVYLINVTDTDGCIKGDSILIGVYDPVFIPNAFTPNGDRDNDVFRVPPAINFDLSDFVVYNRWGTKIFETSDITQGWDGTYQGNKCDVGTYVYIITGSNAKGKVFIKGYVSLFR
jgi:gliding motility-associated-like protein